MGPADFVLDPSIWRSASLPRRNGRIPPDRANRLRGQSHLLSRRQCNRRQYQLQISTRERPILPVAAVPQLEQDYFDLLGFEPASLEEAIAEKIRAARLHPARPCSQSVNSVYRQPLSEFSNCRTPRHL
jgi:hypothetical protein